VSGPAARFVGNDIVDRGSPLLIARSAQGDAGRNEWLSRHLTRAELSSAEARDRFWEIFAAKEAASKAFAQAGVSVSPGAFCDFEVDLAAGRVAHRPTDLEARIALLDTTADSIHAVVVYPGFSPGDRLAARVEPLPDGASPSEAVREVLAGLLARESGHAERSGRYAVASRDGRPRVLEAGQWREWSVSLAHAGRFVAACALLP
jgi:hypothetical protein